MTLTMCFLALKRQRPDSKYIVWSRIDQKSCFKSISAAGFLPLIVEPIRQNDSLITNLDEITRLCQLHGSSILCILSTTSCFAPRSPDRVDIIAKISSQYEIPHVINNAYGLQCQHITKLIQRANLIGRIDYIVQSTDKNFMVPVGGAIVASSNKIAIQQLAESYPGRASSAPVIDLFVTLLALGETGLKRLWVERERLLPLFIDGLQGIAEKYGERVLVSPHNSISIAVSIHRLKPSVCMNNNNNSNVAGGADTLPCSDTKDHTIDVNSTPTNTSIHNTSSSNNVNKQLTYFGSLLFHRLVSGTRVVVGGEECTSVVGFNFAGWGSSSSCYPLPYFTAACAVGLTEDDISLFLRRLDSVFREYHKNSKVTDNNKLSMNEILSDNNPRQLCDSVLCNNDGDRSNETLDIEITNNMNADLSIVSLDVRKKQDGIPIYDSRLSQTLLSSTWLEVYNAKKWIE